MPNLTSMLPKRGALATLVMEVTRELTRDDILTLQHLPATSPPPLQQISARHRRQAMLLAEGKSPTIVADALGVTPARIYQLLKDPYFIHLVSEYQEQINEKFLQDQERIQQKLLVAGETALDEINNRLEGDAPSSEVPFGELRKTVELAMDRTVAPPKNTVSNNTLPPTITLNFGTKLKTINADGDEE